MYVPHPSDQFSYYLELFAHATKTNFFVTVEWFWSRLVWPPGGEHMTYHTLHVLYIGLVVSRHAGSFTVHVGMAYHCCYSRTRLCFCWFMVVCVVCVV